MERETYEKIKNISFWIMILLVVGLSIFIIIYIRTEGYNCLSNPLVYGVSLYEDTGGEFICDCSSPNIVGFYVTKNGINQRAFLPDMPNISLDYNNS